MNWYKRLKFAAPPIKFNPSPEIVNQINKWYALPPEGEGLTLLEIAKRLDVSIGILRRFFQKNNIKIRSNKEQISTPFSKSRHVSKKRKELFSSEIEKIKHLYLNGYSLKEIANFLKMDIIRVKRALKEADIPIRGKRDSHLYSRHLEERRKIKPEDISGVIELYLDGHSATDIAEILGVHRETVISMLKRENIQIRDAKQYVNTEYALNKNREKNINRWKKMKEEGIDYWTWLDNFLQKHIQKFPLEQREQEYERKRKEILRAINARSPIGGV